VVRTVLVRYIGHATVIVDLDGTRIVTDPVLRRRVLHLRRRGEVAPDAFERVDAVVVSHAHWDHLDSRSLALLGGEFPIVVPVGAARLVGPRRGDVVELDVGECVEIGGVLVEATYAEHDARRGPLGVRAPALGYLLTKGSRVYFAGDTDLFAGMAALAPLDLALLPIAGWGPRLPAGHLDPRRAAEALRLLRPRCAIPIHWGTYSAPLTELPSRKPADAFARLAGELAPDVEVRVLAPGESCELVANH
jgi:L-ascorbate metabolism protein UlaG (beta-lactamase superfamily)